MIKPFTNEFRRVYREAFQLFIDGSWGLANQTFQQAIAILKQNGLDDPLSNYHINYMKEHDFMPPGGWMGYKHFDE